MVAPSPPQTGAARHTPPRTTSSATPTPRRTASSASALTTTLATGLSTLVVLVLAAPGLSGCSEFDECSDNSDCPAGWDCIVSRTGWVRSAVCAPQEDKLAALEDTGSMSDAVEEDTFIPPTCDDPCTGELADVPGGICDDDGTLCALDCSTLESRDDCDGMLDNGCETDTDTSDAHCGACNNDCVVLLDETGQRGHCEAAMCMPTECQEDEGFFDLDGDATNGCELHADLPGLSEPMLSRPEGIAGLARPWRGATTLLLESAGNWLLTWHDDAAADVSIYTTGPTAGGLLTPIRARADTEVGDAAQRPGPATFAYEGTVYLVYSDGTATTRHELDAQSAIASDVTLALRPSVGVSVADFVVLVDGAVEWLELVPEDTADGQLPGSPTNPTCFATAQGIRKTCILDSVTLDPGSWSQLRVLDLADEPLVLVTDDSGSARQFGLDTSTGTLEEWQIDGSSSPIPAAIDIEPWTSPDGASGFAVLTPSGAVHFFDATVSGTRRITHTEMASRAIIAPTPGTLRDLVPLGGSRQAILADNGIYVVSGHAAETRVVFFEVGGFSDGWLGAARAPDGEILALTRGGQSLYHLTLTFPQD